MGFNTSFMVLNDQVHDLSRDPNVGQVIQEMVQDLSAPKEHRRYQFGYRGLQAIHCSHADNTQIVGVGRNSGTLIGFGSTVMPIIDAAVALSKTKDPAERRRLIRQIEDNGRIHDAYPVKTDFTM